MLDRGTTPEPTTQFPESPITETLREQAALGRPVRRLIFDSGFLADDTGRNLGLVSARKNSGPGADCLEIGDLMGPGQVSRIGGSIQRGRSFSSTAATELSSISIDALFNGGSATVTPGLKVNTQAQGSGSATAQAGYAGTVDSHLQGSAAISPSGTSIIFGNSNLSYNITDGFTIRIDGHVDAKGQAQLNTDSSLRLSAFAQLFTQSHDRVASASADAVWGLNGTTVAGTPQEVVSGNFSGGNAVFTSGSMLTNSVLAINSIVLGNLSFSLFLHAPGSLANTLAIDPQIFSLNIELDSHANGGFAQIPHTLLDGPTSAFMDGSDTAGITLISMLDSDGNVMPFFTFSSEGGLLFDSPSQATPLPAALPLFATGLGALGVLGWRRKKKAAALAE